MRRILFDCDPGHDDILAILLALAEEDVEVLGVVAAAGNNTAAKTTANTLKVLSYLNIRGIPVVRGVEHPLIRPLEIAEDVHGETGLDGTDLGTATQTALDRNPIEFMAETVRGAQGPVTLVVTGPMTNTALFLSVYPELKERIECISFMGGACFGGNVTPLAEYNIYVDPEAAALVFSAGVPLLMCGLDVTLKAQIYAREIDALADLGNRAGKMMAELLRFFHRTTTPNFLHPEREEGAHLHDPCAVAALLHPERFLIRELYGYVSTGDGDSRGCTVIDYDGGAGKAPNLRVCFDIDRAWFVDYLRAALAKFE